MLGLNTKWIGLTIEHTGIRYVKLKSKKTGRIDKKGFLPLQPGVIVDNQVVNVESFQKELSEWVRSEGLNGCAVSLAIPPSQIIIRKLSIPSINRKQVEQLAALEVETSLHLPFADPIYDYLEIEEDEDSTTLLVFAASRKLIENYVAMLETAGLKVQSVEISAMALARLFTLNNTDSESFSETMLIHLDHGLLDIYLFHSSHPVFMRTINLNDRYQSEDSNIEVNHSTETLSYEQMVEIVAEVSRMMNFYQNSLYEGSSRLSDIIITGPNKSREQLSSELGQVLPEISVRAIGFESYPDADSFEPEINEFRVALGTALRAKGGFSIDLLPREDREAQLFPYVAIGLFSLWIIGLLLSSVTYIQNRSESDSQVQGIQSMKERGTLLEAELASLNKDHGKEGSNPDDVIAALKQFRMNPVAVLDELSSYLPEGAVIRDISYVQNSEISLAIDFVTMEDASAYLVKLRTLSFAGIPSLLNLQRVAIQAIGSEDTASSRKVYEMQYVIRMNKVAADTGNETDAGGTTN
ncbi:type IV pilus assembly protein PilM [Paenibacillus sp. DS2015]|uniref:pilus assembly protein PilM n=1 Tax=Paenibacillus sp. DS2015 TaxID=3373917 RepID=UPI003D190B8F